MAAGESVAAVEQRQRYMMDAPEVAAALDVKIRLAYKQTWNRELKSMGKLTIRDKVNCKYFDSKLEA